METWLVQHGWGILGHIKVTYGGLTGTEQYNEQQQLTEFNDTLKYYNIGGDNKPYRAYQVSPMDTVRNTVRVRNQTRK